MDYGFKVWHSYPPAVSTFLLADAMGINRTYQDLIFVVVVVFFPIHKTRPFVGR